MSRKTQNRPASTESQPKRLVLIAKTAMALGRKHLARYGSYKSRHDFTQPQLMTCLILKAYFKTSYRGVSEQLEISGELRRAMGLGEVPHWTTLQKFAQRQGTQEVVNAMLATLAGAALEVQQPACVETAMDSTGFETSSCSAHYAARSGKQRGKFVKASVLTICGLLLPVALVMDWGPSNDKKQARELLNTAALAIRPDTLFADAGYDAEWIHRYCHEDWDVSSIIKPVQHRADGKLGGEYRSAMTPCTLKRCGYGRRWHAETLNSAVKRVTGANLRARSPQALFNEAAIRILAYAIHR